MIDLVCVKQQFLIIGSILSMSVFCIKYGKLDAEIRICLNKNTFVTDLWVYFIYLSFVNYSLECYFNCHLKSYLILIFVNYKSFF